MPKERKTHIELGFRHLRTLVGPLCKLEGVAEPERLGLLAAEALEEFIV